jgi:hypothetical protein
VSEIDTVALLAGVEKAAASIHVLNTDYVRLHKTDSVAIDFQGFLEKIYVDEIARDAGYGAAAKERPTTKVV